ncbi:ubiquitin carboxyl-terminal hydrolase 20-like [Solanum pennellii]|uniref:Ubiquitin carboxyl-terminal hydrolase n=1 Tax=Solanum pennellii TaxID=28526 RepID=A0ABM1HFJ6_SOLPN|nr:ubiquitin carboxyl-terminal hydrolase 20-like [Solanum pennellii]
MKKVTLENVQTSPDHDALKSQEIEKNNIDLSLVKTEVEEKNSDLNEYRSPVRVDSDSMGCVVSSDGNELLYSGWAEWSPSTVAPISSIKPENFKETVEETRSIENKPSKTVGIGLSNLGNTCFLNAVLQCIMHTVVLLQLLASIDHISPYHTIGFCVVCMIRNLVNLSMVGAYDCVSPRKIVSHLREPQDNIVKESFGGRFVSKLRCCNCEYFSVTQEPFIDISLDIEDIDSVPAALNSFTKIEKFEFSCEMCEIHGSFEKQLLVDRAPSVAALHLKRFKNNGTDIQKVEKHVSFPLELDMLLYTNEINNEEMKYDLYAIIVHSGSSMSSGHYYSFIRCAPNEWYKFNDKQVDFVEEDFVLAQEAYVIFYAKRDTLWFSDYTQIYRSFINLVIPTTSNNHILDVDDQVYCEDQLHDVEIKKVCSKDEEESMDVNEKKRKLEDSPSKDVKAD